VIPSARVLISCDHSGKYLDGRLKLDRLISRTYKLVDEINNGFTAFRSGRVARGVVVFS
jgi:Zn-dependent alcohol dehydrogenase